MEELRALGLLSTPEQPAPRPIQWEDVAKLTYLNNVIKARARSGTACSAGAHLPGSAASSLLTARAAHGSTSAVWHAL